MGVGDKDFGSGMFKINMESDPKEMDLTFEKHRLKQYVGRTGLGIYKIEDTKLFLVAPSQFEGARPWKFEDGDGGNMVVFTKQ